MLVVVVEVLVVVAVLVVWVVVVVVVVVVDAVGDVVDVVDAVVLGVVGGVVEVLVAVDLLQGGSPVGGAYSHMSQRSLACNVAPPAPPLFTAPISAASRFASVLVQNPPSNPSLSGRAAVPRPVRVVSVSTPASRRRTA